MQRVRGGGGGGAASSPSPGTRAKGGPAGGAAALARGAGRGRGEASTLVGSGTGFLATGWGICGLQAQVEKFIRTCAYSHQADNSNKAFQNYLRRLTLGSSGFRSKLINLSDGVLMSLELDSSFVCAGGTGATRRRGGGPLPSKPIAPMFAPAEAAWKL